jgi:hypothetical protein
VWQPRRSNAEATAAEYTFVYAAMQVSGDPKLGEVGQVGQSIRSALASALSTLKAKRKANIFTQRVDEIQAALDEAVDDTK